MSFGFSAGDFVAAIGLVVQVGKAIADVGGAASEYQHVQLELRALKSTLEHLQALGPDETSTTHINAIRGVALACQIPLQAFLDKIQCFETSLGPFPRPTKRSLTAAGRKAQWSLFWTGEVAKLRAVIAAKVLSINSLLGIHISTTVTGFGKQCQQHHNELLTRIVEQRSKFSEVQENVSGMLEVVQTQSEGMEEVKEQVVKTSENLENLTNRTESIHMIVTSTRDIGSQLLHQLRGLPQRTQELLKSIMRTNLEMYSLLRDIQESIIRLPSQQPQDSIFFEDVLGRKRPLPYEFFRHFEMFDSFLRTEFKDRPGEERVLGKHYLIMDPRTKDSVVTEEEWSQLVFPGSFLTMSILIERLRSTNAVKKCPKPDCTGIGQSEDARSSFSTCDSCGLQYSSEIPENLLSATYLNEARPASIGPQDKSPSTNAGPWFELDGVEEDDDDVNSELEDEDSYWDLDTRQARRDMLDLRVFRRIHVSFPTNAHRNTKRSYVFFDIAIDKVDVGRIIFELLDDVVPKTAANFRALCTGEMGVGISGKTLHYKGSTFHRVIRRFLIQAGDFTEFNGTGGESIYGTNFPDESFKIKHDRAFILSMANCGRDTNGSQFFIMTVPDPHLNCQHVVFGHVVSGRRIVRMIERQKTSLYDRPVTECKIIDCGEYLGDLEFAIPII